MQALPGAELPRALPSVARLCATAGILVLLLWRLGAASPYVHEIATHAVSGRALALYLVTLSLYAVFWEVLARVLQRKMQKQHPRLALWLPALSYAALHARYGALPAAYALGVGWASARCFATIQRVWPLCLWHFCWDLAAVSGVLVWSLLAPGPLRAEMQLAYKSSQVERGFLVHHTRWGWLDLAHARPAALREVLSALDRAKSGSVLVLSSGFHDALGTPRAVVRQYRLLALPSLPKERWALASSLLLDLARQTEQIQEESPWWWGVRASAWQAEDLASTLWLCLRLAPVVAGDEARAFFATLSPSLRERWGREGPAWVLRREESFRLPEAHTEQEARDFSSIQAARSLWEELPPSETVPAGAVRGFF